MAQAAAIPGTRLEDTSEVEQGIASTLADDGPVLIDAVVNRTQFAMPIDEDPALLRELNESRYRVFCCDGSREL
jgi:thiamine pyrophosphate-dependent acetolactate synthase large subunit-like protein